MCPFQHRTPLSYPYDGVSVWYFGRAYVRLLKCCWCTAAEHMIDCMLYFTAVCLVRYFSSKLSTDSPDSSQTNTIITLYRGKKQHSHLLPSLSATCDLRQAIDPS
ncbi:unnamed protein product [Pylaiella littoralis]